MSTVKTRLPKSILGGDGGWEWGNRETIQTQLVRIRKQVMWQSQSWFQNPVRERGNVWILINK